MTTINISDLKNLWEKTLGESPATEQFAIWEALHIEGVIRQAILKTAMKNQSMKGAMDSDHRLRYASKVMTTLTTQHAEHAANREKLRQEFDNRLEKTI